MNEELITFGPIPSRRLGKSLGINNLPQKICSYSCIFCQAGNTTHIQISRTNHFLPETIFNTVKNKVQKLNELGETIDYISFVPNGEPTLDVYLGTEIEMVKSLGIKVAVITNSSLLWMKEVQNDLMKADLVSLKVNAITESIWKKIDRPHEALKLTNILSGIENFSAKYKGVLITETMMLKDFNDSDEEINKIAKFLTKVPMQKCYISIPVRPAAEPWVRSATEHTLTKTYQDFLSYKLPVELLIGYEGDSFAATGNSENDILSITAVHPLRSDAIEKILLKNGNDWSIVDKLVASNKLIKITYSGYNYYLRKLL